MGPSELCSPCVRTDSDNRALPWGCRVASVQPAPPLAAGHSEGGSGPGAARPGPAAGGRGGAPAAGAALPPRLAARLPRPRPSAPAPPPAFPCATRELPARNTRAGRRGLRRKRRSDHTALVPPPGSVLANPAHAGHYQPIPVRAAAARRFRPSPRAPRRRPMGFREAARLRGVLAGARKRAMAGRRGALVVLEGVGKR